MKFESYQLPDGKIVKIDADLTRGAAEVSFTLKGGLVVMAKSVAVVEAAERHADRIIAAAQELEAEARRLKDHAKTVRALTRTGRFYSQAEIDNFDMHKVSNIESAARRAVELAKGER